MIWNRQCLTYGWNLTLNDYFIAVLNQQKKEEISLVRKFCNWSTLKLAGLNSIRVADWQESFHQQDDVAIFADVLLFIRSLAGKLSQQGFAKPNLKFCRIPCYFSWSVVAERIIYTVIKFV